MAYSVARTKSIIGAAFISYIGYAIIYSIHAIKLKTLVDDKLHFDKEDVVHNNKNNQNDNSKLELKEEIKQQSKDNKNMRVLEIQEDNIDGIQIQFEDHTIKQKPVSNSASLSKYHIDKMQSQDINKQAVGKEANIQDLKDQPENERDPDLHKSDNFEPDMHDIKLEALVDNSAKIMIWYWITLTFCAERAATDFAISISYICLIFLAILTAGHYLDKVIITYVGYGLSVAGIFILYLIAMINEPD